MSRAARIARVPGQLGWYPDADPINCTEGAWPRFDNLVLDEEGIVSLRKGSATLYAPSIGAHNVFGVYSTFINNVKARYWAAGPHLMFNDTELMGDFADVWADASFCSHMGQVICTRGSSQKKHDGTTLRNWGIVKPTGKATAAALAADYKVFATCDNGESPGFVADEGAVAQVTGQDGVADNAVQLTAESNTARAAMTKTLAAETDYTAYVGGGKGTDDDLIDFYVLINDPANIKRITLMFDCNGSSVNRFQDDYYMYTFEAGLATEVQLDSQEFLDSDFDAEGFDRYRIKENIERRQANSPRSVFRVDVPVGNAGWNHFSVPRGKMTRIGQTVGKGWKTIKAIRFVVEYLQNTNAVIALDNVQILGGDNRPLTGTYRYRFVGVYNSGKYEGQAQVSDASDEINLKCQGVTVTIPAAVMATVDSQVSELWIYRMGGYLDRYYRVGIVARSGSGDHTFTDIYSDRQAMIWNSALETQNIPPPTNVVEIAGPHYQRIFVLTATHLYISRRNNPDSFAANHVIKIAGPDETCLWIKKAMNALWIGTTKDIYRVSGRFEELPDMTLGVDVDAMGEGNPPLNKAACVEGDTLCYLAQDGWRMFTGGGSQSLTQGVRTMFLGTSWTRSGVSYVSMGLPTQSGIRHKAAMSKGVLSSITPEGGAGTNGATTVYRRDMRRGCWYRHVYPVALSDIFEEPDGTLIAGTVDSRLVQLDTGNQDPSSADIPVVLWSRHDDLGLPLQNKQLVDIQYRIDTYQNQATVKLYLDNGSSESDTHTLTVPGAGVFCENINDMAICRLVQFRLTGSFNTFKFYGHSLGYWPFAAETKAWDTGPIDLGSDLVWIRQIYVKVRGAASVVVYASMYFADTLAVTKQLAGTAVTDVYTLPVGRGIKGAAPRIKITSSSMFQPEWIDVYYSRSGRRTEKEPFRVAAI